MKRDDIENRHILKLFRPDIVGSGLSGVNIQLLSKYKKISTAILAGQDTGLIYMIKIYNV